MALARLLIGQNQWQPLGVYHPKFLLRHLLSFLFSAIGAVVHPRHNSSNLIES